MDPGWTNVSVSAAWKVDGKDIFGTNHGLSGLGRHEAVSKAILINNGELRNVQLSPEFQILATADPNGAVVGRERTYGRPLAVRMVYARKGWMNPDPLCCSMELTKESDLKHIPGRYYIPRGDSDCWQSDQSVGCLIPEVLYLGTISTKVGSGQGHCPSILA